MRMIFNFLAMAMVMVAVAACGGPSGDPKEDAPAMIKEMSEVLVHADDVDEIAADICGIQVKYCKAYVEEETRFREFQDEMLEHRKEVREMLLDAFDTNPKLSKQEIQEAYSRGCGDAEDIISAMLDEAQK